MARPCEPGTLRSHRSGYGIGVFSPSVQALCNGEFRVGWVRLVKAICWIIHAGCVLVCVLTRLAPLPEQAPYRTDAFKHGFSARPLQPYIDLQMKKKKKKIRTVQLPHSRWISRYLVSHLSPTPAPHTHTHTQPAACALLREVPLDNTGEISIFHGMGVCVSLEI